MKFDWFMYVATLNHGLERKLADSNPWFAMMVLIVIIKFLNNELINY